MFYNHDVKVVNIQIPNETNNVYHNIYSTFYIKIPVSGEEFDKYGSFFKRVFVNKKTNLKKII